MQKIISYLRYLSYLLLHCQIFFSFFLQTLARSHEKYPLAQSIAEQKGIHEKYVFAYKSKPVTRANNHAWRKALLRAEIEAFRWHDLRKTWASWHRINGTPLDVIQELGGWSSHEMVEIYAFLSSDHLQQYAGNVSPK